jgi:hypothetical protein
MSDKFIGFLQVLEIAPDTFLGAILVTLPTSVPVEFRVTLPVRPTSIQKSLYGDSMVPYIGTELCGTQLLESITHDLELVLVSPQYMLGVRPNSAAPVIFLENNQSETPSNGANQDQPESNEATTAKSWQIASSKNQPIFLTTAPGFAEDYNTTQALIAELAVRFDLLEPFERIKRAIDVLAEQDKRFGKS